MNKKQLKKIFKRAEKLIKEDAKVQKSFDNFVQAIAPNGYSPLLEYTQYQAYRTAVDDIFGIGDDLSYYFFEVLSDRKGSYLCRTSDGKEYDAKNLDEYIDFILEYKK
jgi:hypothetical protein